MQYATDLKIRTKLTAGTFNQFFTFVQEEFLFSIVVESSVEQRIFDFSEIPPYKNTPPRLFPPTVRKLITSLLRSTSLKLREFFLLHFTNILRKYIIPRIPKCNYQPHSTMENCNVILFKIFLQNGKIWQRKKFHTRSPLGRQQQRISTFSQ